MTAVELMLEQAEKSVEDARKLMIEQRKVAAEQRAKLGTLTADIVLPTLPALKVSAYELKKLEYAKALADIEELKLHAATLRYEMAKLLAASIPTGRE